MTCAQEKRLQKKKQDPLRSFSFEQKNEEEIPLDEPVRTQNTRSHLCLGQCAICCLSVAAQKEEDPEHADKSYQLAFNKNRKADTHKLVHLHRCLAALLLFDGYSHTTAEIHSRQRPSSDRPEAQKSGTEAEK